MSIQTELSRIINAKAAIKAAIEGKGVTVPEATLLDGMAALIESIEAGSGSVTIITGSVIPASSGVVEIDLKEYGYDGSSVPKARFLFEDNALSYNDTSHACRRTLLTTHVLSAHNDPQYSSEFISSIVYASAGSNSFNASVSSVANFWNNTNNPKGSSTYDAMNGRIMTFYPYKTVLRLYAFDPETNYKYGCIVGRQYRWGVIL